MLPESISLNYLVTEPEGQYFDRKSARIKPAEKVLKARGLYRKGRLQTTDISCGRDSK